MEAAQARGRKVVALNGYIVDVTDFVEEHPGGQDLILDHMGQDGTTEFLDAHPQGILKILKDTVGDERAKSMILGEHTVTVPPKSEVVSGSHTAPVQTTVTVSPIVVFSAVATGAIAAAMVMFRDNNSISTSTMSILSSCSCSFVAGALCMWQFQQFLPAGISHSQTSVQVQPLGDGDAWVYGKVDARIIKQLSAVCGAGNVFDASNSKEIKKHSRDMSSHMSANPDAVVYPKTVEEAADVVKICYAHRIPMTPRGAGSGLEGGAIPYNGGVVLDLMRLKNKLLRKDDMLVTVEAGVKKSELNEWLEPQGVLFGPDPASNPSVGGMASTRGSGLSTLMYGTTGESVVSLRVITAEGNIVTTRRSVRKSSTGYELTKLYVGSEGTLGIIAEITAKVFPLPAVRCGALVRFASVGDAARATIQFVQRSLTTLCRCELLNADGVRATNKKYGNSLEEVPTVFLEFRGGDLGACKANAATAEAISHEVGATAYEFAESGDTLDTLWTARRGCYIASMSYREQKGDRVYISDSCVPLTQISNMIGETEKDFLAEGFPCIICAHIADGNFHCCIPYQPGERGKVDVIEKKMIARALAMGGSVSGEHGVGVGKIEHVEMEHGAVHIDLQRRIKRALDPHNIMNPGKIFIQPKTPGGCCEIPAIYRETVGASGGTYQH
eukprot:m.540400 g.540400  ORF g.540400 m.540400 type:complete len:670 (+) comp22100_c0_seq1:186-2195(+)